MIIGKKEKKELGIIINTAATSVRESLGEGTPFILQGAPLGIEEFDETATRVLLPWLEFHGFRFDDALANLTDIRAWAPLLTVLPSAKKNEMPIISSSAKNGMDVTTFRRWASKQLDQDLSGMDVFNLADEMYWWLRYIFRCISGMVSQSKWALEQVAIIEEEE